MPRRHFRDDRSRARDIVLIGGWDMERVALRDEESVDGPTWEDVEKVWKYLWKEERIILKLMQEGKTPTDVSIIMQLNDKRRAWYEMQRVVRVVKFFVEWNDVIKKIRNCDVWDRRVVRLFVCDRVDYKQIGKKLGYKSMSVCSILRRMVVKFRKSGKEDLGDMLAECYSTPELRSGRVEGRRRKIMGKPWRRDVARFLLDNVGEIWYVWGGQDLVGGVADCSGLVIEVLKMFGVLPESFRDTSAQGLSTHFNTRAVKPEPGDLVFYGTSWRKVSHVMFYLGKVSIGGEDRDACVVGMCGGRRGMNKEYAMSIGAGLWVRTSPYYRSGLLGFRRVL